MSGIASAASHARPPSVAAGAVAIALAMAATVGGALLFEHVGGYIPCALCLEQRDPYYVGVPIMLAAAALAAIGRVGIAAVLIASGGLAMAYAAYLGVFHAGVEWGFWPGPADCGATTQGVNAIGGDLLGSLDAVRPPSCDQAALRVLGLSFAGWQAIAATALMIGSFWLVKRSRTVS